EKAVKLEPANATFVNTLGAAYYRASRFEQAVTTLQPNLKQTTYPFLGWDLLLLAMCHQELGDKMQAHLHYDLAVVWAEGPSGLPTDQAEELAALRAEAAELLGLAPGKGRGSAARTM